MQTSKRTYNAWQRYLSIESFSLHLSRSLRQCLIRYPTHVVNVRIPYPNLWIKDPPIIYESLSNLRDASCLNTLTLQFSVVKNCALDTLMINLLGIIACLPHDALQLFTLRLYFNLGIYPWRRGADEWTSMAWQHSQLFMLLYNLCRRFAINIECLYNGSSIYEADVVRESQMRAVTLLRSRHFIIAHI